MVDALGGFGQAEEAERRKLGETAAQVSASCLSLTTVAAAQAAIRGVQPNTGRGVLGEPAADLRRLRTDDRVRLALDRDLAVAQGQARMLIGDALWMGYRTAAENRAKQLNGSGLTISVDLTAEDRADAAGYPILGLTAAEWAESLTRQLREAVDRALAAPLTGTIDPATIPTALAQVAQAHAQRVSQGVEEAHAAGCQAAFRAIGAALTGAT